MHRTIINNRWELFLPEHRAARPEWETGWEVPRLDSMAKNIGPGDVVYDIGTEEGDISALCQSWIGKGDGGMFLFEPNERVWPNIRAIWEANHLKMPICTFVGFAGEVTRGDFRFCEMQDDVWPPSAHGPLISDHGFCQLNERPDIKSVRLDDFCEFCEPPTVMTIDVEGSEYRVLRGAEYVLRTAMPIIYLSVHDTFMREQYGDEPQHLYDFMADLGYRSKILGMDHELHVAFWHPLGRELRF